MSRHQVQRRNGSAVPNFDPANRMDDWLRAELQSLHRDILNEPLPSPIERLLRQLEATINAGVGSETGSAILPDSESLCMVRKKEKP